MIKYSCLMQVTGGTYDKLRKTQGPFIQVMRSQPQGLVIGRFWVNCLSYVAFQSQEDGDIIKT